MLAGMRRLHADFAALPVPRADFDVAAEVDRRIGALASPPAPRPLRSSRRRWWQWIALAPGGAMAVPPRPWLRGPPTPAAPAVAVTVVVVVRVLPGGGAVPAAQMAAFSALPPGALCPVSKACGRPLP